MDESSARAIGQRHPKFTYYPHQRDYGFRAQDFRPFVTFVNPPNYRSASVNIDGYGLRESYDADGRYVELDRVAADYASCRVLLGSSAAFGVGASSDRSTISAGLTDADRPCLNFGVRAVGCRQELAQFLALRHLLPAVDTVVIFSGANEAILAGSDRVALYRGYGAVFADHLRSADEPTAAPGAPTAVHSALDRVARLGRGRARPAPPPVRRDEAPELSFEDRLDELLTLAEDTLETWSWVQEGMSTRVIYVLQPVLPWTEKSLTAIERECLDADLATIAMVPKIVPGGVHEQLRDRLGGACARHGLEFHDANSWFGDGRYDDEELFFDVVHLTDAGNDAVAARLRDELSCFHA